MSPRGSPVFRAWPLSGTIRGGRNESSDQRRCCWPIPRHGGALIGIRSNGGSPIRRCLLLRDRRRCRSGTSPNGTTTLVWDRRSGQAERPTRQARTSPGIDRVRCKSAPTRQEPDHESVRVLPVVLGEEVAQAFRGDHGRRGSVSGPRDSFCTKCREEGPGSARGIGPESTGARRGRFGCHAEATQNARTPRG